MMLRHFYWVLAMGPVLATLGCSGPVPAAPAVGLRLAISQSGSCNVTPGAQPTTIGNPPPDSTSTSGAGNRVYSGDEGVSASCGVRDNGNGNFTLYGSISAPSKNTSFRVEGGMTGNTGTATISFSTPTLGDVVSTPADMPCTLEVVQSSKGAEIHPGAVWTRFNCTSLRSPPTTLCSAGGEFILENCAK